MKKLFSTPLRAVVSTLVILVIIALIGTGVGFILVRGGKITKAEAQTIAVEEAGLDESDVSGLRSSFDFDNGEYIWDVQFYHDGVEYEYEIMAKNGDIISKDTDGRKDTPGNALTTEPATVTEPEQFTTTAEEATTEPVQTTEFVDDRTQPTTERPTTERPTSPAFNPQTPSAPGGGTGGITVDEAKRIALADAGLSESDVVFTKTTTDRDGTLSIFDIEFHTDSFEYDYEIDANTGAIYEKNEENLDPPKRNPNGNSQSGGNNGYIGESRAKEIALNDAGRYANRTLTESDVDVLRIKLDHDDMRAEYEIDFYYNYQEYDYTIDALTGDIIDYDVEPY